MMKKLIINFRFPTEEYPEVTKILTEIINELPNEVLEFLAKNPIMFSAEYKNKWRANAFTFNQEELGKAKALIHLQHHIWDYDKKEIKRIVFHEIAHIFLGHKAPINKSYSEFKEQSEKQEEEADKLVRKWLE